MLSRPQRIHCDIAPSKLIMTSRSILYPSHFASMSRSSEEPPVRSGSFAGYQPPVLPVSSPMVISWVRLVSIRNPLCGMRWKSTRTLPPSEVSGTSQTKVTSTPLSSPVAIGIWLTSAFCTAIPPVEPDHMRSSKPDVRTMGK